MADPKAEEFDPNERIAGFSLLSIKHALTMVGIMEDRDDIAHVARSLGCPEQQAVRVLEELERRGLVTKGPKRKQWDTTKKGHRLVWYWHPPPVLRPAIEYEASRGSINEEFQAVPCSIWRYTEDEEEMFEDGELDVGIHVDYDTDRLIEINVSQIDQYQGESHGASTCELSVYISPTDAKNFVAGLQEAIERAEKEAALRVTKKAHRAKREEAKRVRRVRRNDECLAQLGDEEQERPTAPPKADTHHGSTATNEPERRASVSAKTPRSATKTSTKRQPTIERVVAPPSAPAPPEEATRSGRAVAAALAELRATNQSRREAAKKRSGKADE